MEMPYSSYKELEKAYEKALSKIAKKANIFNDLFETKPDLEVVVVQALIDQDESLTLSIKRRDREYGFTIGRANEFLNPKEAASAIIRRTPNGWFCPEEWEDDFYKNIQKPLAKFLVKKEMKRRGLPV